MVMGTGYGKILSLPLPSGNKVRVRRVSLLSLVKLGQIPPQLISAVWAVFGRDDASGIAKDDNERVQTMVALMDQAVRAVLIDIKIVEGTELSDTSEDKDGFMIGTVNVGDIPDSDKALIFGFAQGSINADPIQQEVAEALAKFPGESARETPGPVGETLRSETKQDDRAQTTESAGAIV
jgi:hypothetical protein